MRNVLTAAGALAHAPFMIVIVVIIMGAISAVAVVDRGQRRR